MLFAVVIVLVVLAFYLLVIPVVSWVNARLLIPRRLARLGREPDFPVNVIVPCYGETEHLEENLRAIASQDYPRYVVSFVTDTADDAATKAISAVVASCPAARHIVAGISERASGKNYAQIVAIEGDPVSEVFVIFDSDMRPARNWLREMVRPFVDPKVQVTASSRWIVPAAPGIGPRMYTALEGFRPMMLAAPLFTLVWGGCFALRRSVYTGLGLADQWSTMMNDDLVLCKALAERGVHPVFAAAAMSPSLEVHATAASLVKWFARQALVGKLHAYPLWALLVFIETLICAGLVASVALFAAQAVLARIDMLSLAAPVLVALMILNILLIKLPYRLWKDMPLAWWLALPVPGHFVIAYALWVSVFQRKMRWGGVTLEFNRDGTIARRT